jgi:THO complex subunit 4
LRKASILYDRSGRSTGSAEIEFTRSTDAQRALDQYNNVPLDGRAMKITLMGGGDDSVRSRVGNRDRSRSFSPRRGNNRGGGGGGGFRRNGGGGRNGGGRGGGGGGRGGREKKEEVTQEQLDKEMDEYLNSKK